MEETPKVLYRYDRGWREGEVDCWDVAVLRVTPKGYWVRGLDLKERWVARDTVKRYAYPTKKEALTGFIARTRRAVSIQQSQLQRSQNVLKSALYMHENFDTVNTDSFSLILNRI